LIFLENSQNGNPKYANLLAKL